MVVCLAIQEQESQTVLSVAKTSGLLKTRMASSGAELSFRSIAQKPVGLFVRQVLSNVIIVVKKSKPLIAKTSSIVIWNAETKGINIKRVSKLEHGKAIKHLTPLYINGLHRITRSLIFVNTAKRKAIQSGLTYHRTITEKETTGLISANRVILYMMANSTRTLDAINKYVDVIRKRYAKFVNNNELPDNWEELTPAIAGK